INLVGKTLLNELNSKSTFYSFLKLSSKFTKEIGLYSNELMDMIEFFEQNKILSAQIMLGDGLFFTLPNTININDLMNDLAITENTYHIESICKNTVQEL
ncbi:MAG: hypothetical protein ACFFD1_02165, partial [Candidatus Thorarchaeota archaeon]